MFVRWAPQRSETGASRVAAGFDAAPHLNIFTQVDPTLPLPRARIHQNRILTANPLLPDSGRSEYRLIFGRAVGAPFPRAWAHGPTWLAPRGAGGRVRAGGPGRPGPPKGGGRGRAPRAPANEAGQLDRKSGIYYISKSKGRRTQRQYINGHYNVEDLCRSFPRRLQQLVDKQGDRINR